MKMRQAVVFGAGAIGLGLLGDLLSKSCYETTFVDIDEKIVSALHTHRSYRFNMVGSTPDIITVPHVDGLISTDETALAQAIARSEVIFTAAGGDALASIARVLAQGLVKRMDEWRPTNIVCSENLRDPAALLKAHVLRELSELALGDGACNVVIGDIGFANTIISKMCKRSENCEAPSLCQPVAEGLNTVIEVERGGELLIDQAALVDPMLELAGAELLGPAEFAAERDKKTFAHNGGHAFLSYLGALKGYSYVRESGMDDGIRRVYHQAIVDEIGEALIRKYPDFLSRKKFGEYVDDVFSRMISPFLNDTIKRGVRSSIRKIGGHDARLTRAAKVAVEQGITPYAFCLVIAAALIMNNIGKAPKKTGAPFTTSRTSWLNKALHCVITASPRMIACVI